MDAPTTRSRGLSLIEALLALAVMGFGMLAVLGMQSTLRVNGDLSRQRTEALRLAQDAVEQWRAYSVLDATTSRMAFADIVTPGSDETIAGTNATYTLRRIVSTEAPVTGADSPRRRLLVVRVGWRDRADQEQVVELNTVIAEVAPELAATVALAGDAAPARPPLGRHRGIPPQARDFGGKSGYVPPQPSSGTVGWWFDNTSGWFTVCIIPSGSTNSTITAGDFSTSNCGTQQHLLLQGYVRYATTTSQPTAADVTVNLETNGSTVFPRPSIDLVQTSPTSLVGRVDCFEAFLSGSTYREYNCAVPIDIADPKWSGRTEFVNRSSFGVDFILATDASDADSSHFRVCRYFAATSYVDVITPLLNQNFVVILAGDGTTPFTCPSGVTWTHQP